MKTSFQMIVVVLLAMILAGSASVRAAEPDQPKLPTAAIGQPNDLAYSLKLPEPPDTGAMLMRLGMGTAFVLVLCVGTLWFGKPWLMKLQTKGLPGQALQIEGSVTLGGRAVLYLVKVGDTQLVAGTDPMGLKSLVVLPASFKEVLDEQVASEDAVAITATPANFESRLRTAAGLQGGSL